LSARVLKTFVGDVFFVNSSISYYV